MTHCITGNLWKSDVTCFAVLAKKFVCSFITEVTLHQKHSLKRLKSSASYRNFSNCLAQQPLLWIAHQKGTPHHSPSNSHPETVHKLFMIDAKWCKVWPFELHSPIPGWFGHKLRSPSQSSLAASTKTSDIYFSWRACDVLVILEVKYTKYTPPRRARSHLV